MVSKSDTRRFIYLCPNFKWVANMMTSSNAKIFGVTGLLCGEFTCHRTKASDAELWCFLWSTSEPTDEQTIETQVIWDAIALIMGHCNERFDYMEGYRDSGHRSNHWDGELLRRIDQSTTPWWLQMSWGQKDDRPSTTTILTRNGTQHIPVASELYYAPNRSRFERGGEVDNPLVFLLLTDSSSHDDNVLWRQPHNMSHHTALVDSS